MIDADFDTWDLSPQAIFNTFTENLLWNLFLTSTALHAIVLIASPIQAVHKWWRRKSSDSDTPLPYICAVVGSALWLRYAMFIGDLKLVLLQTYAVAMQLAFLVLLLFYRSKRLKLMRTLLAIGLFMFIYLNYISNLDEQTGKRVVGWTASSAQIAGSLVCPWLVFRAIKTRVIDFIPFLPVMFTCIMELHAIIYAIGIDDFYLLLANAIFCFNDSLLLSMFFVFPTEAKMERKMYDV